MKYYLFALVAAIILYFAHTAGLDGYYYTVPIYDVYMHIFGGVAIGLFLYGLGESFLPKVLHTRRNLILGVLVIGIIWELFEAYFGIAGAPVGTKAYYIDTVKDLIDDVVGGGLVTLFLFKSRVIDIS